ncbi:MAG: hypothetical protein OEU09_05900, partial [Rhodospirillales bacterium]|nr:hypothetical protein [Rhodospirillales bacterium]
HPTQRSWAAGLLALVWLLAGPEFPLRAAEPLAGPVPAVVTAVVDGDTLEVRARIWLGQELTTRVRLAGIDAPEAKSDCPRERALAARARAFLSARLRPAGARAPAAVRLHDIRNGKYAGGCWPGSSPPRVSTSAGRCSPPAWRAPTTADAAPPGACIPGSDMLRMPLPSVRPKRVEEM